MRAVRLRLWQHLLVVTTLGGPSLIHDLYHLFEYLRTPELLRFLDPVFHDETFMWIHAFAVLTAWFPTFYLFAVIALGRRRDREHPIRLRRSPRVSVSRTRMRFEDDPDVEFLL